MRLYLAREGHVGITGQERDLSCNRVSCRLEQARQAVIVIKAESCSDETNAHEYTLGKR